MGAAARSFGTVTERERAVEAAFVQDSQGVLEEQETPSGREEQDDVRGAEEAVDDLDGDGRC